MFSFGFGCGSCFPVGTDQLLNVESTLIQRWASTFLNHPQHWYLVEKIVDFVTMINQKSTSQPQFNQKSTKFEVEISLLKFGWQLVDFQLILGWEVDFGLIIITKSMISQPNINADIWLRNWSVPIGFQASYVSHWYLIFMVFHKIFSPLCTHTSVPQSDIISRGKKFVLTFHIRHRIVRLFLLPKNMLFYFVFQSVLGYFCPSVFTALFFSPVSGFFMKSYENLCLIFSGKEESYFAYR